MAGSIESIYSSAFFELLEEEHGNEQQGFEAVLSELADINNALADAPELAKLCLAPSISDEDKLSVIKSVFGGKTSPYVFNFICVLARKKRMGLFGAIYRDFRRKYYDKFGIMPVTVTGAFALTADQRARLVSKMEAVTGKKVFLNEKIDKNIIGGVVVDYGGSRIDGSVKNRLYSLKKEIAEIVL
ncbi:MAG: ATP synthase F1 subunit delta [Oscillospiraceae bacterium]|nr:ATP synthase F1 subunit delta [Oscillospiraceae bacterium]